MTQRPLPIPPWAPIAAGAAFVVWAVSIWWMVATLPAGDTRPVEDAVDVLAGQLESTNGTIEALAAQVADLEAERDALARRVEEIESLRSVPAAATSTDEEAGEATEDATADEGDTPISASGTSSRFFTNGADRYNCRDFTSHEEAQEALAVNGPDDPNRIDMNRNGLACEDFVYPSASAAAPAPAATAGSQSVEAR